MQRTSTTLILLTLIDEVADHTTLTVPDVGSLSGIGTVTQVIHQVDPMCSDRFTMVGCYIERN